MQSRSVPGREALADRLEEPMLIVVGGAPAPVLVIDTSDDQMPAIGPIRSFLSSDGR